MTSPPRRLTFAVSTSLLTASLSLGAVGCDEQSPTVNPAPEKKAGDDKGKVPEETVNVGPEDDGAGTPEEVHVNEGPEPDPELHVNEGPEPDPKPEPNTKVNPGPEPESVEPKRVNTRPDGPK